jgi:hypothetical protein
VRDGKLRSTTVAVKDRMEVDFLKKEKKTGFCGSNGLLEVIVPHIKQLS